MTNTLNDYDSMVRALRVNEHGQIIPLEQAALGLAGEVSEVVELIAQAAYAPADMVKELGDVCWYATALCIDNDWSIEYTARCSVTPLLTHRDLGLRLVVEAGAVCEMIKKATWHEKDYTGGAMHHRLANIFAIVRALASYECSCLETIMQANMDKLAKRWPNGFGVST